jgi:hypothetical protein
MATRSWEASDVGNDLDASVAATVDEYVERHRRMAE